ncbi:hypothetical protein FJTKL_02557 [Diaporthe vaccinii]|uniref:FAD-binding domain-containing protein n=1 Tax=Diaporthe vaccinii TaxID=105482 RepID=A0ABR4DXW7_9PEZI
MPPFKVIIVGGGLGGSLLANGLMNNDVDFTLYERDPADSKREGYQIRMGDTALEGFEACLTPDHVAAIKSKLGMSSNLASTAPILCTSQFKVVLDLSQLPSYSRSAAINRVVLRNLLLAPVQQANYVKFEKAFSRFEIIRQDDGLERVKVHFSDGSSDLCDVLVGADGSGSKINKQVGARNIVDIDSHWCFVQKGSLPPNRVKILPPRLLQGPLLGFSEGYSFYFALYLPPSSNGVPKDGKQLEYNVEEASFYWGLNVPKARFPGLDVSETENHLKVVLEAIKTWAPVYHTMISIGGHDDFSPIIALNLRASMTLSKTWRRNLQPQSPEEGHPRVWLMGDAIHAMQPNRGMGGNQALRDCVDLLPPLLQLNEAAKSGNSPSTVEVKKALYVYESKMIDRAFAWVQKSGGASMPNFNFDGYLGTTLYLLGLFILPIWRLVYYLRSKIWG